MRHMSREFALHGTRTGKLAVARANGAPHVTPVWFLLDADDEHGTLLHWAERLGTRYMGEERGSEFGRRNAVAGELLVRGTVTRVIAPAGVAD